MIEYANASGLSARRQDDEGPPACISWQRRPAMDAMERLDVEMAKAELED